ncbi:hypothetical protein ACHAWF_005443 [Thalassiosira exigua]
MLTSCFNSPSWGQSNSEAFKNVVRRLPGASGRGMWDAGEDTIEKFKSLYADADDLGQLGLGLSEDASESVNVPTLIPNVTDITGIFSGSTSLGAYFASERVVYTVGFDGTGARECWDVLDVLTCAEGGTAPMRRASLSPLRTMSPFSWRQRRRCSSARRRTPRQGRSRDTVACRIPRAGNQLVGVKRDDRFRNADNDCDHGFANRLPSAGLQRVVHQRDPRAVDTFRRLRRLRPFSGSRRTTSALRQIVALLSFARVASASAYDFLVTSQGGFYEAITDATTGEQIGERFQNPAVNAAGDRIGTSQGFAYNFPPDSSPDPANRNWIFFLDGGQVEVLDEAIVMGTGSYEKYTGGRVEQKIASVDPEYVSEITLVEPRTEDKAEDEEHENNMILETFRITSEGGFFNSFTSYADGKMMGEMFQSPVLVQNTSVGTWEPLADSKDQGFGYRYVSDAFIEQHEANGNSMSMANMLANRIFFLPGGELTTLEESIVQGTGMYSKYTGGSLDESIISMSPTYVAEITLKEKEPIDADATLPEVTLLLNPESEDAIREPITNATGVPIGMKIQVPVSNEEGTLLGTMLGYVYDFPNPAGQTRNGNRKLYLEGGSLTIFNDAIVRATGTYVGYTGGRAPSMHNQTIAMVTLVRPPQAKHDGTTSSGQTSGGQCEQCISNNVVILILAFLASHLVSCAVSL